MPAPTKTARLLIDAARELSDAVDQLRFRSPITHVYNPLVYARPLHEQYLTRFGRSKKRILMLGMNPGPWGMAQTGVPFGEVAAVRDWMKIAGPNTSPATPHPKRPIEGLECSRSEVSGRRLWGLMAERFGTPKAFFADHFVVNYCPLVFMEPSGKNFTPDKLPKAERDELFTHCDTALKQMVDQLQPKMIIGVGKFAEKRAKESLPDFEGQIATILHPSPASPAANKGWAQKAEQQLKGLGVL